MTIEQIERRRKKRERYYAQLFGQAIADQVRPVIQLFERGENPFYILNNIGIIVTEKPLFDAMVSLYFQVSREFGEITQTELQDSKSGYIIENIETKRIDFGSDMWLNIVRGYVQNVVGEKITWMTETTRNWVLSNVQAGIDQGYTSGQSIQTMADNIAATMRAKFGEFAEYRAVRIARTEIVGASNWGSLTTAKSAVVPLTKLWIPARDSNVRQSHRNVKAVAIGDMFSLEAIISPTGRVLAPAASLEYPGDPNGPAGQVINCFTGDTLVSFDNLKKVIRSKYTGELITIKTTNGYKFTATPNHPILTTKGFVNAGDLDYSHNLICNDINKSIFGNFDINHIIPTFKQVFNTLDVHFMRMRISGANVNLYNRIRSDKDVDIIDVNSKLPLTSKTISIKDFSKLVFKNTYLTMSYFFSLSSINFIFNPIRLIKRFNRFMCSLDLMLSLFISHLRPFKFFSFALASNMDFVFGKNPSHNTSRNIKFFSRLVFRESTLVSINNFFSTIFFSNGPHKNIISFKDFKNVPLTDFVELTDFSGRHFSDSVHIDNINVIRKTFSHNIDVFTLETDEQIYNANGIIAKNCRCAVGYQRENQSL